MSIFSDLLAQANGALESYPILLTYGPMGIMLAWFMWMSKTISNEIIAIVRDHGIKIDNVIHKLNGLRMAMLVNTISNEKTSDSLRKFCEEELARASANANANGDKPKYP